MRFAIRIVAKAKLFQRNLCKSIAFQCCEWVFIYQWTADYTDCSLRSVLVEAALPYFAAHLWISIHIDVELVRWNMCMCIMLSLVWICYNPYSPVSTNAIIAYVCVNSSQQSQKHYPLLSLAKKLRFYAVSNRISQKWRRNLCDEGPGRRL